MYFPGSLSPGFYVPALHLKENVSTQLFWPLLKGGLKWFFVSGVVQVLAWDIYYSILMQGYH